MQKLEEKEGDWNEKWGIVTTQTYNIVNANCITALNTHKKTKTAESRLRQEERPATTIAGDPFPQRHRGPTGQPISSWKPHLVRDQWLRVPGVSTSAYYWEGDENMMEWRFTSGVRMAEVFTGAIEGDKQLREIEMWRAGARESLGLPPVSSLAGLGWTRGAKAWKGEYRLCVCVCVCVRVRARATVRESERE